MKRIVFISDTHTKHDKLNIPECDILIHAGDWSFQGKIQETIDFAQWLDKQPATHIILIPANHEVVFERVLPDSREWITDHCPRAHLLIHESLELEGIKFFGSPYTPAFGYGWAWNAGRTITESAHIFKPFIGDLWKDIPEDTQILITHGPGLGTFDEVLDYQTGYITNVGCKELSNRIQQLKDLKIHVFGHLHLGGSKTMEMDGVTYINAAMCDDSYNLHRKPVIVEYE